MHACGSVPIVMVFRLAALRAAGAPQVTLFVPRAISLLQIPELLFGIDLLGVSGNKIIPD